MKKTVYLSSVLTFGLLLFCLTSFAADPAPPDVLQRHDPYSSLTIGYEDLDTLLQTVVLDTGPSTREIAKPTNTSTGTRMKVKVNRATMNEGNRFYFEIFNGNEKNQQIISHIRNRLENLPTVTPLERFSRKEQLAYWINLYNVTILDEIVKVYPKRNLKGLLVGKNAILSKKILNVAGVPLSLNDIQFTILRHNYDNNPLIIYGLYQGIIGGPNIRKYAYSGSNIYGELADNAVEFINSNRGTQGKDERAFHVSSLYQRNAVFFDESGSDLTDHLLRYLEGEERDELQASAKIKMDISDWTITDLYGSYREAVGSLANNNAALLGSLPGSQSNYLTSKASKGRYNPAVTQQLGEINEKRETNEPESIGVVTVEELENVDSGCLDESIDCSSQ
jgi:hypothetical protein